MQFLSIQKVCILLIFSILINNFAFSKEGMWQPSKLKEQEKNMKEAGLQIPVELIYNEKGTGLNNAIVIFGRGCTGEVISKNGLVLTNHHCGYGTVQELSSEEHNYLLNGFWAKNNQEEIPCPGLTVSFVREMKDVSHFILSSIPEDATEEMREKMIAENIAALEKVYSEEYQLQAQIKPFYEGNQYWLSLIEVFKDVRMVGVPPNGIGKFGADTDNWMWPRMTGDFALFRIYASKDNKPAEYNINNVPYRPKVFLPISTSGYKEGDFTMVYGFPYVTREYISSFQLEEVQDIMNPIRIQARKARLEAMDKNMRTNPSVFLKYAAKQASISNGYKKWQGELSGLAVNDVLQKKREQERYFQMIASNTEKDTISNLLLTRIKAIVNGSKNALKAEEYSRETVLGIEIVQKASIFNSLLDLYRKNAVTEIPAFLEKTKKDLEDFYKNYDLKTDRDVFLALMPIYMSQGENVVAPTMKKTFGFMGQDYQKWANYLFNESALTSSGKMEEYLNHVQPEDTLKLKQDPAFIIYHAVQQFKKDNIDPVMKNYREKMKPLNRQFMKKQLDYFAGDKDFYPDANQTLRVTYGQVQSIDLRTSNIYQTTLEDLIPRHNPEIEEFDIPTPLIQLYEKKDYGRWQENKTVPINFIASNHTSGGNSGSPVLNSKGALIGLNFDRIWQGTMSDLYYDPNLCRNISVDIRYVLFIIEKYGKASWLFKEMKFVK